MGRQESSPPRQRHRMPHHRHHHHHHDHYSDAQTTDSKPRLNLGRLNRVSDAPNSHAIVESWLGQVPAPTPTRRLVSLESRNQPVHHGKRPCSSESDNSPLRRHPIIVDPSWRPQHIPPAPRLPSPPLPLTRNGEGNRKRHKRYNDDSSFISGLSCHKEPRRWDCAENPSGQKESSRYNPLDPAEVDTAGVSSTTSPVGEVTAFEKRARFKTRADKYIIKKLEGRERRKKLPAQGEHQPRRSKSRKRKRIAVGKNVMNNFSSDAVVNERITPKLKPGIFSNKRVSKYHPVTDLSFSEMRFLSQQEREAPQEKGLSSSRLRRESRELEHVSSFFQPTFAGKALQNKKPSPFRVSEVLRSERRVHRDDLNPMFHRDSSITPSSPTVQTPCRRQQPYTARENLVSLSTVASSKPGYHPDSSKATTYFTWSSSHHSPSAKRHTVDTHSTHIEPAGSMTPESTRKALVATGVYRHTGIRPYDVPNDQQHNHYLEKCGQSAPTSSGRVSHDDTYGDQLLAINQELEMRLRHPNDTETIVALPAHVEERWNKILPSGWRPQRSSETDDHSVDKQLAGANLDISPGIGPSSRQGTVQGATIQPIQKPSPVPRVHPASHGDFGPNCNSMTERPASLPQESHEIVGHEILAGEDRVSFTSRDAMPPPPIPPPRCSSLNVTILEPGDHLSSSTRPATVSPLKTPIQMSHCKSLKQIDICPGTSQPQEPSNEPENMIPILDLASWIPQAAIPTITSHSRQRTLSRLSTRSPLYESHDTGIEHYGALRPVTPHMALATESMADFIARIESEAEKQPHTNEDYCQSEPTIGDQELPLDPRMSAYDTQDQQFTISDSSQGDPIQPTVGLTNELALRGPLEMSNGSHSYEKLGTSIEGRSIMRRTEGPRDDTDKFLEMSNFWRPNQFSHF